MKDRFKFKSCSRCGRKVIELTSINERLYCTHCIYEMQFREKGTFLDKICFEKKIYLRKEKRKQRYFIEIPLRDMILFGYDKADTYKITIERLKKS